MNKSTKIYADFTITHDEAIADIIGYPVSHVFVNYSIAELEEYFRTRRPRTIEDQYINTFVEICVRMIMIKKMHCEAR